jgi:hypothetical protein
MDKEKIFNDIKSNIETFCHRNFITSDFNKNSRMWKINFSDVTINVILSKSLLNITFFAVVSKRALTDPAQKLAVFEKLLKMNANLTGPGFSLSPNDEILLTYTRSVEDLDYNELSYLVLATRRNLEYSSSILSTHMTTEKRAQPSSVSFAAQAVPQAVPQPVEPMEEVHEKNEIKAEIPAEKPEPEPKPVQTKPEPELKPEKKPEPVSDFSDDEEWEF